MKISTLLAREPFDKVFEKTMTSFFSNFTNNLHNVKWYPKTHNNQNTDSIQRWYCNPLINSIFVSGVNSDVFNSINGEYSHNPLKPWRSSIQKLYLSLSQHKMTSTIMSKYVIEISPPIKNAKNKLIVGGNKKIRLIDIANRKVYVILKDGFDKKYLEKEIYVRTNFKFLPVPKIHTYDSNALWFCEEYISGISPNRMEGNKGRKIILEVIQCIHKMLNKTKVSITLSEYVVSLKKRINESIERLSYIDINIKKNIKCITLTLANHLEKYSDQTITIAYCHGDFHQGNILSDGEKYWILDWENSGQNQIGYDLFILLLESRIESGFCKRFLRLMNNEIDSDQWELINNWPDITWDDKALKNIYLILFLLEDLSFHVDEKNNDLFYRKPNALTARYKELEKILIHTPFGRIC